MNTKKGLYIQLFSIHGPLRSENLQLGRDADTGGQIKYVLELAKALVKHKKVQKVGLFTRFIADKTVSDDEDYHFPSQFTADMLSMNKPDFIITNTLQEIIGTDDTMGQYESYQFFSMPQLYQVINGINLFAPKFNVIPLGVDEELYFPYFEHDRRIKSKRQHGKIDCTQLFPMIFLES